MTDLSRRAFIATASVSTLALFAGAGPVLAENLAKREKIDKHADEALAKLLGENKHAKELAEKATAILIFPKITEAGLFGVGAKRGAGVLRQGGKSIGYYRTNSLSVGLEAGFETHGYVLMFMTHEAAQKFASQTTIKLGGQGEITVFRGVTAEADGQNLQTDIAAFIFNEKGLMLNLTIEGTEIHRMDI